MNTHKKISFYWLVLVLFGGVANVNGQLYDMQWTLGPNTSVIDFRNDTITTRLTSTWFNTFLTSADICDEAGNLLYITNGIFVTDRNGNILENGDTLSPCPWTFSTQQNFDGLDVQQGALFLPKPGSNRYYYLFHFSEDTLSDSRPGTLYYSIIDRQGNFGLGSVVQKNVIFAKGIFRGGGMTACRHANGRDWWIVVGGSNNNKFNKFLFTTDGLSGPFIQNIGPVYSLPYDNAYSCFSQDGSKYATVAFEGYITVLDFDRCSGEFSNPVKIFNNISSHPLTNPITGGGGIAFSPNGRFIYVTGRLDMNQYDLWSATVQDSSRIYTADSSDFAQIHFVGLAPNGKIYCSTWAGGGYFLHVINKPDEKGDSCNFVYGGFTTLSDNSNNLPNFPNYRLGALSGSACDTLTGLTETARAQKEKILKLYPNPATDFVTIDYGFTDWNKGNADLEITNELGQIVHQQHLPMYSGFQKIDVSTFASGFYTAFIKRGNMVVATAKFAKQ